jgi:hypothetical protein
VQADEIVLDGIEDRDTQTLADALRHAVGSASGMAARTAQRRRFSRLLVIK